ncbi:MAG: polysaccharide biosynthesis tyrosine autokinase [Planctomycetota bacterium]|nr:polysaccharide biosynthesis tyrosine autokinase [Planctomycetota bacterium]
MSRHSLTNGYGGPSGGGGGGGYGESAYDDDTIDIGELFQILVRKVRLIAIVTACVLLITLIWTATRRPAYKAVATLLLEQDEASGGVLSELASLTSDPAAEAELAIIRSRSLAETTASTPSRFSAEGQVFAATQPDFDPVAGVEASMGPGPGQLGGMMDRMGLMTVVEPFDLRPAASMWARISGEEHEPHRLLAQLELAPSLRNTVGERAGSAEELPEALDVFFKDSQTVVVVPHEGFLFPSSLEAEDAVTVTYAAGQQIEAFGHTLHLVAAAESASGAADAVGSVDAADAGGVAAARVPAACVGQRYRVSRRDGVLAVRNLIEATSASESGRKTNVINITVEDASPFVAAETANALAKNYIRRSVQIGQQKARRTVSFIQAQLGEQLESLTSAETTVAALQRENPSTISLSDSAVALIEQASALELERTQLDLARTVLTQALGHLERGDYAALARLGQETPSLMTLGYIQELATLETEALRLERTDVAGYKQLLLAEELRLRVNIDNAELEIAHLESGLAAVAAGDAHAIARFAAAGTVAASGPGKVDLSSYFDSLAELDGELARMRGSLMPDNPALLALVNSRTELVATITAQVRGALAGARAALTGTKSLHSDYRQSIDAWPASERGTIDSAVATLQARVRQSITSQVSGLGARIAAVTTKVEDLDERLGELPQEQLRLAAASRNLLTHSEIVAFLQKSLQQTKITAAATSAAAVLIDPAVPPTERAFPRSTMFMALGLILGLLLGCAAAFVANALQAALHTEAEVERASGLSVLGSVPDFERGRTRIKGIKKGSRILPMRADPNGPQAEAYRSIRASLRQALHGEDALKTLACTSCLMGEGKTTTNADLAIVFAKAARRVLLVDGDLRKPQIHNLFDLPRGPGFAEVLESQANWQDCLHETNIENLTILPAGQTTASPGELLASTRALTTIDELKQAYDLIVFDLPPAVVVADVANFASNLDALLLIYRSGMVPGRVLTSAVARLRQAEVNLLGVIMNAVYVSRVSGEYGYGYGYGKNEEE